MFPDVSTAQPARGDGVRLVGQSSLPISRASLGLLVPRADWGSQVERGLSVTSTFPRGRQPRPGQRHFLSHPA